MHNSLFKLQLHLLLLLHNAQNNISSFLYYSTPLQHYFCIVISQVQYVGPNVRVRSSQYDINGNVRTKDQINCLPILNLENIFYFPKFFSMRSYYIYTLEITTDPLKQYSQNQRVLLLFGSECNITLYKTNLLQTTAKQEGKARLDFENYNNRFAVLHLSNRCYLVFFPLDLISFLEGRIPRLI